jgi:hypothetical protein
MNFKFSAFLIVFAWAVMLAPPTVHAKAWRGILPLHSTRANVEKTLGRPTFEDSGYELGGERVTISYATRGCEEGLPSGWNVPLDTVVNISVNSTKELRLDDVLTPGRNYEKIYGTDMPQIEYVDVPDGVSYATVDGMVQKTTYFGNQVDDQKLRCGEARYAAPAPAAAQNKFEQRPLDLFGKIPFEETEARLDTFIAELLNLNQGAPHYLGYIVVYAGRSAHPNEAANFAKCAKNYLVTTREADPETLFAANGGYRDEFTVELFIMPNDAYPPLLTPTVSPRKVKILPDALDPCRQ